MAHRRERPFLMGGSAHFFEVSLEDANGQTGPEETLWVK
jgi:hypothetical protein